MWSLDVETWQDELSSASSAAKSGDEDWAAEKLTDSLCSLLEADPKGELVTDERIRRILKSFTRSGRKFLDYA